MSIAGAIIILAGAGVAAAASMKKKAASSPGAGAGAPAQLAGLAAPPTGGESKTVPPAAPWRAKFDAKWADPVYLLKTYKNEITRYKEEMFKDYLWPLVLGGGGPRASSPEEVIAYLKSCAAMFGQPWELIRAIQRHESGQYIKPFSWDVRGTAAGLGSTIFGSACDAGIAHPEVFWWRGGVWATCRELHRKGWPEGTGLPSAAMVADAEQLAGTPAEPKWYKAMRGYYSLAAEKLAASKHNASLKLMEAIDGWQDDIVVGSGWDKHWLSASGGKPCTEVPEMIIYQQGLVLAATGGQANGEKALAALQGQGKWA